VKNFIALFIIAGFALGCNIQTGDNTPGPVVPTMTEDITPLGTNAFTPEKKLNPGDPELVPAGGCSNNWEVDPRLAPGMKFETVMKVNVDGAGFLGAAQELTITSVDAVMIKAMQKATAIKGITGVVTGQSAEQTCTVSGTSTTCTSSLANAGSIPKEFSKYNSCSIQNMTSYLVEYEKGKLFSNRIMTDVTCLSTDCVSGPINAIRTTTTVKGEYICDEGGNKTSLGMGEQKSVHVYTFEMPSHDFRWCGRTDVNNFGQMTLDNGRVLFREMTQSNHIQ
jgi:hypothetical protein